MDYLKVKVGDRVRRTQRGLSGEALSYLGANNMDDLRGTLFRVAALRQGGMVYLEVFEAGGILPQGHVLAVPDAYFTAPYWQRVPPLVLKLANAQELELAQAMVQEKHYMQRRVHKLARPVAHLVLREYDREPLGALLYARPQCARVYGSAHDERTDLGRWGNINDVRGGRVQLTQWQVINLSRFYLDPCLQRRESRDYVPNAAFESAGGLSVENLPGVSYGLSAGILRPPLGVAPGDLLLCAGSLLLHCVPRFGLPPYPDQCPGIANLCAPTSRADAARKGGDPAVLDGERVGALAPR